MQPPAVQPRPSGEIVRPTPASRGQLLLSLARTVPDGVVVFVPSFQYETQLVERWQATGAWRRLGELKALFREPRQAADLDQARRAPTTAAAHQQRGRRGGAPARQRARSHAPPAPVRRRC